MSITEEIEDVRHAANLLEQGIYGMIGLGVVKTATDADAAIAELKNAYTALDAPTVGAADLAAAREAVLKGERALELAIQLRGWWWRLWNVHQVGLFVYHLVFFAVLLAVGTACFIKPTWCVLPDTILGCHVPLVVLAMGGLGAELRALWFLWQQIGERLYRRRFLLGHLVAPFTGALLGIVTYLVAKAGLLIIGGTPAAAGGVTASELALCFFAGFKWEWAVQRIQRIFENAGGANGGGTKGGEANGGGTNGAEEQRASGKGKEHEARKDEPTEDKPKKNEGNGGGASRP